MYNVKVDAVKIAGLVKAGKFDSLDVTDKDVLYSLVPKRKALICCLFAARNRGDISNSEMISRMAISKGEAVSEVIRCAEFFKAKLIRLQTIEAAETEIASAQKQLRTLQYKLESLRGSNVNVVSLDMFA